MVVDFVDAQWPQVQQTVTRLLRDMQAALEAQPHTSTWTDQEARQAHELLQDLQMDWQAHRVRRDRVAQLEHLSAGMNVSGCTVLRANLEALRGQLILILQDAAAALHTSGHRGAEQSELGHTRG